MQKEVLKKKWNSIGADYPGKACKQCERISVLLYDAHHYFIVRVCGQEQEDGRRGIEIDNLSS